MNKTNGGRKDRRRNDFSEALEAFGGRSFHGQVKNKLGELDNSRKQGRAARQDNAPTENIRTTARDDLAIHELENFFDPGLDDVA